MTFTFWQPILSIHQSAFLRSLADTHEVILILERDYSIRFQEQGWTLPDAGNVQIYVAPSQEKILAILNMPNAIHCFSGIRTCKMHYRTLKIAIKKRLKIGVMLEPFNYFGLKGKCRFLMYIALKIRYNKKISFLLTTGNQGRWCYEKTGFSKDKIFDWGYFTEEKTCIPNIAARKVTVLFVGSIDERKNILQLVGDYKTISNESSELQIIGAGHLEAKLKEEIKHVGNICFLGVKGQSEVLQFMANSDLLVLPSMWDGWGAVVNEALMQGTPVIASDRCGSSVLLDGEKRGEFFSIRKNNLKEVLGKWISKGKNDSVKRNDIAEWTRQNITGKVASDYFLRIVDHVFQEKMKGIRPLAPWLKNR